MMKVFCQLLSNSKCGSPGEITTQISGINMLYKEILKEAILLLLQATSVLFTCDCEGSEPDSHQIFWSEENGQHFLKHFYNGFNSGDPCVDVKLYV